MKKIIFLDPFEYRVYRCKCGRYTFRKDYRELCKILGEFNCEDDVSFGEHLNPAFYPL